METKKLIEKNIESQEDLIKSYEESINFCKENKDWILCNNYQIRISATIRFINELKDILEKAST
jgi:hypothetical protein